MSKPRRQTEKKRTPLSRLLRTKSALIISLSLLIVAGCLTIAVVSANRRASPRIDLRSSATTTEAEANAERLTGATPSRTAYVSRGRLWSRLQEALRKLGDRLEKPGKERLILIGTLSRSIDSQVVTLPARVIWELPGRLRIEEQDGSRVRITGFSGRDAWKAGGNLDAQDQDLLETLGYDSAEHFLIGQSEGVATRFLGDHFRLDGGDDDNYSGPFYDIYHTLEDVRIGPATRSRSKHYYINSNSSLLEKVCYETVAAASPVRIEVQLAEWRMIGGQMVPGRITRLENGVEVFKFEVSASSVGRGLDDGIFERP